MPDIIKRYRDIDLDFNPHPIKEDIIPLIDINAVKRSVRNLCLLNHYEAPFQPSKGAGLTEMLFENFDVTTAIEVKQRVIDTLARYEKRAKDVKVDVTADDDNNQIMVTVKFSVETQLEPVTVQMFLERAR